MDTETIFTQFEELYTEKKLWPDQQEGKNSGQIPAEYDQNKPRHLIKDGIINPSLFALQSTKVLFIAKDHNLKADYDYVNKPADYRLWWNEIVYLQFAHRLGEWAHGILNYFPDDVYKINKDQKLIALKSIAFINIKKVGGGSSVNHELLKTYIDESRELLYQQIRQISPTHIVCCLRNSNLVQNLFDPANSGTNSVANWDGIEVINFWHPSSRKNKQFLYEQLKEAIDQLL